MKNITELKELNSRLTGLLDNPEPGIGSWHIAVNAVLKKISQFYIYDM